MRDKKRETLSTESSPRLGSAVAEVAEQCCSAVSVGL